MFTPACRRLPSSAAPKASPPTCAISATFAPSLLHAQAWLAPLPPGSSARSPPVIVSPARGNRSTGTTMSMFALPMTTIVLWFKRSSRSRSRWCRIRLGSVRRPPGLNRFKKSMALFAERCQNVFVAPVEKELSRGDAAESKNGCPGSTTTAVRFTVIILAARVLPLRLPAGNSSSAVRPNAPGVGRLHGSLRGMHPR